MQDRNTNKGGNVNVTIGDSKKEGYYIGSATNVARLFIFISVIFGLLAGYVISKHSSDYYNLEKRIEVLEQLTR